MILLQSETLSTRFFKVKFWKSINGGNCYFNLKDKARPPFLSDLFRRGGRGTCLVTDCSEEKSSDWSKLSFVTVIGKEREKNSYYLFINLYQNTGSDGQFYALWISWNMTKKHYVFSATCIMKNKAKMEVKWENCDAFVLGWFVDGNFSNSAVYSVSVLQYRYWIT